MKRRRARRRPYGLRVTPRHLLAALLVALIVTSAGAAPASGWPAPNGFATLPRAGRALGCAPSQPDSPGLAAAVEAELASRPGTYGVAVRNLDTGETYLRRADERFPAASLYKLAVLYETWRQVRLGWLNTTTKLVITPDDAVEPEPDSGLAPGATLTVAEALEAMITISSNSAAHALLRLLDRDAVNRSTWALGLRDTVLPTATTHTGMIDVDGIEVAVTSPRDVLCYLTLVADGQLLGAPTSTEIRKLLFEQRINDRLPSLLPPDVHVAHKTGDLTRVRNDAGIVYTPRGAWVVVVLSREVDEVEATAAIAKLSRRVYDYFTAVGS